jgi:hypothetical protein
MTEDQKQKLALDLLTANYLKQLLAGAGAPEGIQHYHNKVLADLAQIRKMIQDNPEQNG